MTSWETETHCVESYLSHKGSFKNPILIPNELSSLHIKCVAILSINVLHLPSWVSPYENVKYNDINTTVAKTRVSNAMVHLSPSMRHNMTEEVYSVSPGLLKPASLLSALSILLCCGAC